MPDTRYTPEPVDLHVGKMMRHYRTAAGMSQDDLAKEMGIGRQQIRKYEAAEARITANKLFHAARALSIPVANFYLSPETALAPRIDQNMMDAVAALIRDDQSCELVSAFSQIASPAVRKRIVSLTKAVSKSTT